ncbi:hypothetical protein G5I_09367 [Acromyrmex echinatior]|uniref:Uncharacterized protein n=1 Tax=Acromyrmex echinatior TaxID=103372 RepID=F4WU13_ACREC|nr:hypothetical protein G5I_09367 [Acromyrmex echinatior]
MLHRVVKSNYNLQKQFLAMTLALLRYVERFPTIANLLGTLHETHELDQRTIDCEFSADNAANFKDFIFRCIVSVQTPRFNSNGPRHRYPVVVDPKLHVETTINVGAPRAGHCAETISAWQQQFRQILLLRNSEKHSCPDSQSRNQVNID